MGYILKDCVTHPPIMVRMGVGRGGMSGEPQILHVGPRGMAPGYVIVTAAKCITGMRVHLG